MRLPLAIVYCHQVENFKCRYLCFRLLLGPVWYNIWLDCPWPYPLAVGGLWLGGGGAGKVGGGGNWFVAEHVAYLRAPQLWKLIESLWVGEIEAMQFALAPSLAFCATLSFSFSLWFPFSFSLRYTLLISYFCHFYYYIDVYYFFMMLQEYWELFYPTHHAWRVPSLSRSPISRSLSSFLSLSLAFPCGNSRSCGFYYRETFSFHFLALLFFSFGVCGAHVSAQKSGKWKSKGTSEVEEKHFPSCCCCCDCSFSVVVKWRPPAEWSVPTCVSATVCAVLYTKFNWNLFISNGTHKF